MKKIIYFSFFSFFAFTSYFVSSIFSLEPRIQVEWGISQRQGRRPYMEDMYVVSKKNNELFFGMYDGHGGSEAAELATSLLHATFNELNSGNVIEALEKAVLQTHTDIVSKTASGTTALVAHFADNMLTLGWLGDSRAVLNLNNVIYSTKDHKPEDEKDAIEKRGGLVFKEGRHGIFRVYPPDLTLGLACARSLGDRAVEQYLNHTVDTIRFSIPQDAFKNTFLILATDGLWDVLSNQEAVDIVKTVLEKNDAEKTKENFLKEFHHDEGNNKNALQAASELRDQAYRRGSHDNISVIVALFRP